MSTGSGMAREARVALLAEHLGVVRIDGDDPVAVVLHVLGREIARPVPVRGQADDRDDARPRQDPAQARDVVDDRHATCRARVRLAVPAHSVASQAASARAGCSHCRSSIIMWARPGMISGSTPWCFAVARTSCGRADAVAGGAHHEHRRPAALRQLPVQPHRQVQQRARRFAADVARRPRAGSPARRRR